MTVEKVAHDFVAMMADRKASLAMAAPDAMASGGVLPQAIPLKDTVNILDALKTAMPDLKFDVQQVTVNGDKATVKAMWSGTNTGPLTIPMPGMGTVPATGKKISVKDAYIITVKGDKVSHMEVASPADGGIPAALMQMGVKMPSM